MKNKIPQNAKCVFKGVVFKAYQWQQRMFNKSYATFEMLVRSDTVAIIPVTTDNRILILEERQPGRKKYLTFPGGRVDQGEKPLAAAKRELLEETGYKAKKMILFAKTHPVSKIIWTIYTYIAQDCQKIDKQNLDNGEQIKLIKVTFDQFLRLCQSPKFRVPYDIKLLTLEAYYNKNKKDELRKKLFG